jgi:Glutathione S-transferase N-terminal domain
VPSIGPFALKLLAWLELARIPYEQVIEDNPRKGPKGKNAWIKFDDEIGDTELIIELLSKRYGVDLDSGLTNEQKAIGLAWRRTFEWILKRQGGFETAKPSLCLWEYQFTNHFKPQTEISERTDGREESGQHEPPSISRQNEGRQRERQKD